MSSLVLFIRSGLSLTRNLVFSTSKSIKIYGHCKKVLNASAIAIVLKSDGGLALVMEMTTFEFIYYLYQT